MHPINPTPIESSPLSLHELHTKPARLLSSLNSFPAAALIACLLVGAGTASAQTTWYVDDDNCPGPGSGTPVDPFCSIQDGINATMNGDEILVSPGTYFETINFNGKAITLRSSGGSTMTTINANGMGTVVTCVSGEINTTTLDGFTITGGSATAGGGMLIQNSSPSIINCLFSGNVGGSSGGGAIKIINAAPAITSCTFSSNSSSTGGAIDSTSNSSPSVTNTTFQANTATSGGAVHCTDSVGTFSSCTFSDNLATNGAAMLNINSPLTLQQTDFLANRASFNGGAIYNTDSNLSIDTCTFNGNAADDGNTGTGSGGAIHNLRSHGSVSNSVFISNNTASNAGYDPESGGAMLNDNSNPLVTNTVFSGNSTDFGGAVANINMSAPTFDTCTFRENTTWQEGGAMQNASESTTTVLSCLFLNNVGGTGGRDGGAIASFRASMLIYDTVFISNRAGGSYSTGGALDFQDGNYVGHQSTVATCMFMDNRTGSGGAISIQNDSVSIVDSIFSGNRTVSFDGGALRVQDLLNVGSRIEDCAFIGNTAQRFGGAIMNKYDSTTEFVNCTVLSNEALTDGGGIYNDINAFSDHVVITSCLLWNNSDSTGTTAWSQLADAGQSATTVNYSLVQGGWYGIGQNNINANPEVIPGYLGSWTADAVLDSTSVQTTLHDANASFVTDELVGLFLNPDSTQSRQSLITANTQTSITVWGDFAVLGITGTAYEVNDYRISSASPCINTGDPSRVEQVSDMDLEGDVRVQECRVDIGADESAYSSIDCNANGTADSCELVGNDCQGDGIPDDCQLAGNDQNGNGVPDECEVADCDNDGIPDYMEPDLDGDGIPNDCDDDDDGDGVLDTSDICAQNRPSLSVGLDGRPRLDLNGDCLVNGNDVQLIVNELLN